MKKLVLALLLIPAPLFADFYVFYDAGTGEISELSISKISASEDRTLSIVSVGDDAPIVKEGRRFYKIVNGSVVRKSSVEITADSNAEKLNQIINRLIILKAQASALASIALDGIDVSSKIAATQSMIDSLKVEALALK